MLTFAVRLRFTLPLLVFLLAAESCSPPPKPESQRNTAGREKPDSQLDRTDPDKVPGTGDPEPTSAALGKKLSSADKETLAAFGGAYAKAMTAGDDTAARAAWNTEALLDLALGESEKAAPEAAAQMKRGFASALGKKPGGIMWATFGKPWRMLRVHEVDGEIRALFRVAADGALIYFDLIPQLNANSEVEFIDAYAFASGERMSQTFRRNFLPQLADAADTPIGELLTTPDPLLIHVGPFSEFSKSVQTENYVEALGMYHSLPQEIQENQSVLLMYLAAAGKLMAAGEANPEIENAYREGVEKFQKRFEEDPAFLLMGIDYHFYKQDFEGASKAIDKLDKAVGGDPYLDFYRASALLSQEKYQEALPLAQQAAENDPELEDPYWGIVNIQLALGNFEAVAGGLDQLAEKFDYEFELGEDPAYEAFLKSPIGKAWEEKQPPAN